MEKCIICGEIYIRQLTRGTSNLPFLDFDETLHEKFEIFLAYDNWFIYKTELNMDYVCVNQYI